MKLANKKHLFQSAVMLCNKCKDHMSLDFVMCGDWSVPSASVTFLPSPGVFVLLAKNIAMDGMGRGIMSRFLGSVLMEENWSQWLLQSQWIPFLVHNWYALSGQVILPRIIADSI